MGRALASDGPAKAMGGRRSPLDDHGAWLLDLIGAQPDVMLKEVRSRLSPRGVVASLSPQALSLHHCGTRVSSTEVVPPCWTAWQLV